MEADIDSKETVNNQATPTPAKEIGCSTIVGKFIAIMVSAIIVAVVAGTIRHCSNNWI